MNDSKDMTDLGEGVDALVRDIFLAFVRVHLLHHAAEAPIYGAEMIEELARHGYQIGSGTMYPTLHALRKRGYLAEEKRVVGGKVRKYYAITDAGRRALALLRPKVRELVGEVLAAKTATAGERARDEKRSE
jgi:DNA-binding PadR family transcriptional regulator